MYMDNLMDYFWLVDRSCRQHSGCPYGNYVLSIPKALQYHCFSIYFVSYKNKNYQTEPNFECVSSLIEAVLIVEQGS
jgi:hypothetical protein